MNNKKLVVFSASWCKPCQSMKPTIEALDKEGLIAATYDVDTNKDQVSEFNVGAVPTIIVIDGSGKEVERVIGAKSRGALKVLLEHNV